MQVRKCVLLDEKLGFCFHRKQKVLGPSSKLVKIRFDLGRALKNLGYRNKEINIRKSMRQVMCKLIPEHGNSSKTGWNMISLVGCSILMTYYYMSSFPVVWIEIYIIVWLWSPNGLIWQMPFTCSNIDQKNSSLADLYTPHILYSVNANTYYH